jgi:hypothetical protein
MNKKSKQYSRFQKLGIQNLVRRYREFVEGFREDETEILQGFSLCPDYSIKQHRRINRLEVRRTKYGHKNLKLAVLGRVRNVPLKRQLIIKRSFGEGVRI